VEDAEQTSIRPKLVESSFNAPQRLQQMEEVWASLLTALSEQFGGFDKRSVAGEVFRFAHRNRKGARLSYDLADKIARLHSSMKSFRRRQSSSEVWLDVDTYEKFISACEQAIDEVHGLVKAEVAL